MNVSHALAFVLPDLETERQLGELLEGGNEVSDVTHLKYRQLVKKNSRSFKA